MKNMVCGLVLLAIGISTADSKIIILPAIVAICGTLLILIGSKEYEDEDE